LIFKEKLQAQQAGALDRHSAAPFGLASCAPVTPAVRYCGAAGCKTQKGGGKNEKVYRICHFRNINQYAI